jgi:phage/conjugal plasmid C-4 type zinc finger TraR family protein
MTDLVDFANDLVQESIDATLAARSALKASKPGHSLMFCETCDESIPEARRLAQVGCTQCISCQSQDEKRGALYAR